MRIALPAATPNIQPLTVSDHNRDVFGLKYVYTVVSRRARGVSIGVNLNVNNACNWACVYCQVPNLQRGGPPPTDLAQLEDELRFCLAHVRSPAFLDAYVPEGMRRVVDVAFSGNGEPSASAQFADAVALVGRVLNEAGLLPDVVIRVISNGSLLHRAVAQRGFATVGSLGGEVWFKVDRGTTSGFAQVNSIRRTPEQQQRNLARCLELTPTWVQTCWFGMDGLAPDAEAEAAYLDFVRPFAGRIRGVHLYGVARESFQPEASRLSRQDAAALETFAGKIRAEGITVTVSP